MIFQGKQSAMPMGRQSAMRQNMMSPLYAGSMVGGSGEFEYTTNWCY